MPNTSLTPDKELHSLVYGTLVRVIIYSVQERITNF